MALYLGKDLVSASSGTPTGGGGKLYKHSVVFSATLESDVTVTVVVYSTFYNSKDTASTIDDIAPVGNSPFGEIGIIPGSAEIINETTNQKGTQVFMLRSIQDGLDMLLFNCYYYGDDSPSALTIPADDIDIVYEGILEV